MQRLSPLTVADAYHVTAYGAKGDGSTDDTAAIQAALNAAYSAGGGVVFLPAATYIVDPNPGLQVKTNTTLRGAGAGSVLKLKASSTHNDNIVKSESWTNVRLEDFTVDGNRTNQAGSPGSYTYTQYGVYIGGTTNSVVRNVVVKNTTGVGIHIYNGSGVTVDSCVSTGNNYHGYELEQDTGCHLVSSVGSSNLLHGLLVSPGEVSGTGSKGNTITGCTFSSNSNYGIATNAANADVSAWLSQGDIFTNNIVTGNSFYGVNFYKQDGQVFSNNYVAGNGYFGLYAFSSSNNTIAGNIFVNNSQAGNGSYDEILVEGYSSGHASASNAILGNTFLMSGATKARYAVNEATANDGPNLIANNNIPNAGTSGRINSLCATDVLTTPPGVFQIYGTQAIAGANAGIDGAFSGVMRIYNNLASGSTQIVTVNGNTDMYNGGVNVATFTSSVLDMHSHKITNVTSGSSSGDAVNKGQLDGMQPLDSDLTAIAALTPSNDDVVQRKAGAWTNRTPAQLKTDLALAKADVGLGNVDNTSNATERAATRTLSGARITLRVGSTTSSATPTINTDSFDEYDITALAANITSMTTNLSGTPTNGDTLMLRFKDNGTARTITWGTSFVSSGVATLLATTVVNKTHYVGLRYDSTSAKWVCLAVDATGY